MQKYQQLLKNLKDYDAKIAEEKLARANEEASKKRLEVSRSFVGFDVGEVTPKGDSVQLVSYYWGKDSTLKMTIKCIPLWTSSSFHFTLFLLQSTTSPPRKYCAITRRN